jgi:transcriptional regulator with XRE-family HTH domain
MQNNLKNLRIKQGFTQKQVAELLDLDCENRISRWENDQAMPSLKNLLRLANLYGVKLDQLYS